MGTGLGWGWGLWRRRRSPLLRRTDRIEMWWAAVTGVALVVLPVVCGWSAAGRVDAALERAAVAQAAERVRRPAVVSGPADVPLAGAETEPAARAQGPERPLVRAVWFGADGARHTGTVTSVGAAVRPGDRFLVWTDRSGRLVPAPLDPAGTGTYAVPAGVAAGLAAAGLVAVARRVCVRRLTVHRHRAWDRAWAAVGPDWGRTDAGT
ncbi:hypothetical protein ACN20G_25340 [Streptomyces sp. BI20]|uniref:Rv1733c family protein n=1 Tax=Streptomyces sp. BI20 TaxID=3403460 RepID=UPI003C78BF5F